MRIKHFMGYGSVIAKRIRDNNNTLHIRVIGNHECGLVPMMEEQAAEWLIPKFDKGYGRHLKPHWYRDAYIKCEDRHPDWPVGVVQEHVYSFTSRHKGREEVVDFVFNY